MFLTWTHPVSQRRMLDRDFDMPVTPAADVLDDGDSYQIVLEMPGVTQEGLSIHMEAKELLVRGERPTYETDAKLIHCGRAHGTKLEKRFTLGEDIERDGVKAHLENGLLTITLPRKAEVKARKIEIEVK